MKRKDVSYTITKINGKAVAVALCAMCGMFVAGSAGAADNVVTVTSATSSAAAASATDGAALKFTDEETDYTYTISTNGHGITRTGTTGPAVTVAVDGKGSLAIAETITITGGSVGEANKMLNVITVGTSGKATFENDVFTHKLTVANTNGADFTNGAKLTLGTAQGDALDLANKDVTITFAGDGGGVFGKVISTGGSVANPNVS